MLTLTSEAHQTYLMLNQQYARDIAAGHLETKLSDLLNAIHDKYKVVQLYPKLGKEVTLPDGRQARVLELLDGWKMIYAVLLDAIEVLNFVNEKERETTITEGTV